MRSFPDCSAGPLSFPLPSRPGPRRQLSHSSGEKALRAARGTRCKAADTRAMPQFRPCGWGRPFKPLCVQVRCCFTSAETIRDIWVGEPGGTATLTSIQLLSFDTEQVQCCFTSSETIRADRYRGT